MKFYIVNFYGETFNDNQSLKLNMGIGSHIMIQLPVGFIINDFKLLRDDYFGCLNNLM